MLNKAQKTKVGFIEDLSMAARIRMSKEQNLDDLVEIAAAMLVLISTKLFDALVGNPNKEMELLASSYFADEEEK